MRAVVLTIALIMQFVTGVTFAQDEKLPAARPVPEEHKEFMAEVESLYRKYPAASSRYKLVDVGENLRMDCTVECEFDSEWGGWCKDVCELEE
jgi:hypothetical protein